MKVMLVVEPKMLPILNGIKVLDNWALWAWLKMPVCPVPLGYWNLECA